MYNKTKSAIETEARNLWVDVHHDYRWLGLPWPTGSLKRSAGSPFSHRSLVVQKGWLAHRSDIIQGLMFHLATV